MKYIASALVLLALLGTNDQVNAIKISSKAKFTDDLVKSLAEEMAKDAEKEDEDTTQQAEPKKEVKPIVQAQK